MDMSNLEQVFFVEYDDMGAIFGFRSTHDKPGTHQNEKGKLLVSVRPDPLTTWVNNDKLVARPYNPAKLSNYVLTNVPNPCTIKIDNSMYECTSDTVTLDFPNPGIYTIELICFPYQNKVFQVKK